MVRRSLVKHSLATARLVVERLSDRPYLWIGSFQSTSSGGSTGAMSRLTTTGSWPLLTSTFPSTGGGGYIIKGYDPVIKGGQCITTFMATLQPNELYLHAAEYDAVPEQGGTLCTNGRWRSFDGKTSGTTPFRMFYKDGQFRGAPQAAK